MYKVYRRSIFQHYLVWMSYVPYTVFFVYQRIVNGPFNIYVKGLVLYLGIILLIAATGSKGNLLPRASLDLFNTYMEYNVVKNFKNDPDYGEYKFDSSRSFSSIFSN